MATNSIFNNIVIKGVEEAQRLADALEEAKKIHDNRLPQALTTKRFVLELLSMPISCVDCPLRTYESYKYLEEYGLYCCAKHERKKCPTEGRREDYPLTEVEF